MNITMSNEWYHYYVTDGIFHVRYLNFINCHLLADCSIQSFYACLRIQFHFYLMLNILHKHFTFRQNKNKNNLSFLKIHDLLWANRKTLIFLNLIFNSFFTPLHYYCCRRPAKIEPNETRLKGDTIGKKKTCTYFL